MKAPSAGYRIVQTGRSLMTGEGWQVVDDRESNPSKRIKWSGKTYRNARTAHCRLAMARLTGKPVSWRQAQRAGNG